MPSSSSSKAFARRVRRVSAFPSRISAIRSARVPGSRKPPRIIPLQESLAPAPASFFVHRWNRGITGIDDDGGGVPLSYGRVPSSYVHAEVEHELPPPHIENKNRGQVVPQPTAISLNED